MTDRARLVLVTPAPVEGEEWPGTLPVRLVEALDAGRVDAVVLRLPAADDRTLLKLLKPIVPVVQERGAALLLQDAPALVARSGADGAHVTNPSAIAEALETLRPQERIVGTAGLRARHDAMEAAEVGVDYVMFGEPRPDGSVPPATVTLERVEWWAEVFQTPCVAFVHDLGDVEAMTATGCEFVALGAAVFDHPAGPAAAVRKALEAIASATVPQR
ncbi:MAG: thiamine phosphate synthase [Burkholderiales bacterium]|jgi:thiamine-phosphate pyrophosphorylase|nr:thiamine phosphate synthase [Burkholderiales bacterium]